MHYKHNIISFRVRRWFMKIFSNQLSKNILLCLLSAILLGFSQPFVIEGFHESALRYEHFLGLMGFIGYVPLFLICHQKICFSTNYKLQQNMIMRDWVRRSQYCHLITSSCLYVEILRIESVILC